jgi:tetratricopeptide (TPR) repeat protein
MTNEDRLHKNARCDLLMKEGIQGRQDEDAVIRTEELAELAIELGREDCLACALAWYEVLEQRGIRDELAILCDTGRANAIAGNRYGTKWQWEQTTLACEIFYLRRAVSHPKFNQIHDTIRCMILNNLGNRLRIAGRFIESLEYWRRALEVQPNFGMALCNRALSLAYYAHAFEDTGTQALFLWVAHREASAALAPTAVYTHPRDGNTREATKRIKQWIESVMDLEGMAALNPLTHPDTSATKEERDYRDWCLKNRLYLNPSFYLGWNAVATPDFLGLPSHVVLVDASHTFESFFDQMKQEYVSARWMLYEGLSAKVLHFSDKDVPLNATEPRQTLSLAIERVKSAYRISYSLFDKIGFFLNAYMGLGVPERHVSFRRLWRPGDKKPIRKEFDQTGNPGFCALYWLAKDFFEKENDEVAEPEARSLSDIRNYLEHKYLRITVDEPATSPPYDLAFMVSRKQFDVRALHLLGLARSALIYLAVGIRFEEHRRQPGLTGVPIEEIPLPPDLPDAEKI